MKLTSKKNLTMLFCITTLFMNIYSKGLDLNSFGIKMVDIPGRKIKMSNIEVTQKLYTKVMGYNPSVNKGDNNPVENISWYDAVYFCNKLSELCGYTPVYTLNRNSDVATWGYTPHKGQRFDGNLFTNPKANGFYLPSFNEWKSAAKGGQNYTYSGSNKLTDVGWYEQNSNNKSHPVAKKKQNNYGLYDMSGNVSEWVWGADDSKVRYIMGGSFKQDENYCKADTLGTLANSSIGNSSIGFRFVCSNK